MNIESMRAALIASRATIDSVLAQLEPPPKGEWVSVAEAAKRTGHSPAEIRTMIKTGAMEGLATEGGGKWFVRLGK